MNNLPHKPVQRVLVVDDERLIADTLGIIFSKHGFDSRVAYSAETGLVAARDFEPNLLLCDISMPGAGGLQLIEDVTRELPTCRILVLTGHYSNISQVREKTGKLPRSATILTKPCSPVELLQEVCGLLASA